MDLLAEVTGDLEMDLPRAAVVRESRAGSVCQSVWLAVHTHEGGVDKLEANRGRGYASAAVVGWVLLGRLAGCLLLYSTSWGKLASQGVAWRLGLILYSVDLHLT